MPIYISHCKEHLIHHCEERSEVAICTSSELDDTFTNNVRVTISEVIS